MDTAKLSDYDSGAYIKFSNPQIVRRDLSILSGILSGISCDAVINSDEIRGLLEWVDTHRVFDKKEPYRSIISEVTTAISDGVLTADEADNISWYCRQYIQSSEYYDAATFGIRALIGIVQGISVDRIVTIEELKALDDWMDENDKLKNNWPFDEVYSMVTKILKDGKVTEYEQEEFIRFSNDITSPSANNDTIYKSLKTGYFQIDPEILIPEKTFCITGVSKKYKRRHIAERIELYGGVVVAGVSSNVDYLIVCDNKNTCWAFTCYGRKIEQAIDVRRSGRNIAIVHEFDLYDALDMG